MRLSSRTGLAGYAQRVGGHIGGEIQAESAPIRVGFDQAPEHLSAPRRDLKYSHPIANPRMLQGAVVCFGMKKERTGWINRRDHVVHTARSRGDSVRHPIFAGKKEGIVKVAQIWLPLRGLPAPH